MMGRVGLSIAPSGNHLVCRLIGCPHDLYDPAIGVVDRRAGTAGVIGQKVAMSKRSNGSVGHGRAEPGNRVPEFIAGTQRWRVTFGPHD